MKPNAPGSDDIACCKPGADLRSAPMPATAKVLATGGLVALTIGAIWLLSDVLLLVFSAVLVAIGLRRSASHLGRVTAVSTNLWVGLIALSLLSLCAFSAWRWGGGLLVHVDQWMALLEHAFASIRDRIASTHWGRLLLEDMSRSKLFNSGQSVAGHLAGMAMSTFGLAGSALIVVAAAVYLSIDPNLYERGAVKLAPVDYRPRMRQIIETVGDALAMWLLGRLIDMIAVFALTLAGLWLLDAPLALPLAMIAAVLNFIPYIGAFLGAAPAVLVALSQGPGEAASVTLLFFAVQILEGYVISPTIQKQTVALPPAITIFSQTLFGALFGVLGILLAPALAVACMTAIQMAYVEDVLEARSQAGNADIPASPSR